MSTTSTTSTTFPFSNEYLNLTNMEINYNNVAVATSDNASLSIVPLIPPASTTYNIIAPTITYNPRPRSVLANSTDSNILINQNDANFIISNSIKNIDFEVDSTVSTLTIGNDLTLNISASSNGNLNLIDMNYDDYINDLLTSLNINSNNLAIYSTNSNVYLFIPDTSTSTTLIYISNILSNGQVTQPILMNVSVPNVLQTPFIGVNNGYIYFIGLNSNSDLECYFTTINSTGLLGTFNLSNTTFPTITNNLPATNSNLTSFSLNVRNSFQILNGYIYILGNIGSDFEYAYTNFTSSGDLNTWTIEPSLFNTTSTTCLGFTQTTTYENNIYVGGLLTNYVINSSNYQFATNTIYVISQNSNGTLNAAVSYSGFNNNNVYYTATGIIVNNGYVYLLNIYTYLSMNGANLTDPVNPSPIYYSQLDSNGNPTTWNTLSSQLTNTTPNMYFYNILNKINIFNTGNNTIDTLLLNPSSNIYSPIANNAPFASASVNSNGTNIFSVNGCFNTNNYLINDQLYMPYGNSTSTVATITFDNNNVITNVSLNNLPNEAILNTGFIYNNNFYLINQAFSDTADAGSPIAYISQNSYMYSISTYGTLTNPSQLEAPITGLASLSNFTAIVLNNVVYVIGGQSLNGYDGETLTTTTNTQNTTTYIATISSNGTLGTWSTTTSLDVPSVGFATNVCNVNNQYLLAIGTDGNLYSSSITNNIPGAFAIVGSALTFDEHMFTLLYVNGILILGTFSNSSTLGIYYTNYDVSTNTINGWNTANTNIPNTHYPSLYYNPNNNTIIFLDVQNLYVVSYYINNQDFTFSLVPSTAFSSVPTNYYIQNLKVSGIVGNIDNGDVYSPLTLASETFDSGTYTLNYNSLTNFNGGNCYLNISNINNADTISEIELNIQGKLFLLPIITPT